MKRGVAIALAVLLASLGGAAYYLLTTYDPPPVDPAWAIAAAPKTEDDAVTVRWTGTTTLVFSDGVTTWMTDGWFTRPSLPRLLFGKIAPDSDAIARGLARNGIEEGDRVAAVFPVHSHYDHAMDAPAVAARTGAILYGSASTANIAYGWKELDKSQIHVMRDRVPIPLGSFTITPIAARHFDFPHPLVRKAALGDPDITSPVVPPVRQSAYKVGVAWILHVAHPRGTWLVVGSAGYVPGALEGFEADTVFLGIGSLGSQTDAYREAYWRETVARTHAMRVIPIHWDSLTAPIDGPFRGPLRAESLFLAGPSAPTLAFLKEKRNRCEIAILPRFESVELFPVSSARTRTRCGRASPRPSGARRASCPRAVRRRRRTAR